MITVKCGYEGCDWSSKYSDVGVSTNAPNRVDTITGFYYIPATFDQTELAKNILHSDLLKHLEEKHGIPPAIWESQQ